MGNHDYYKTLKVKRDATLEDLNNSYNNLVMKWHPDKINQYPSRNPSRKQEFEANFKRISEAYEVLSDPKKRQIYDRNGQYPVNLENGCGSNMEVDESVGVVESDLVCSLEELYKGCKRKVKVVRNVPDEFGKLKCEEEILKIHIQPGWKKGTKVTFPGKGNYLPGSGPSDVIFVVNERPHAIFKRDGKDLIMTEKISLLEALVGKTLNITTLDGRHITVELDDIVTPGYEKVVADEGMPLSKDPSKRGNLRIKFNVMYPPSLTPQQKYDVRRILNDPADY